MNSQAANRIFFLATTQLQRLPIKSYEDKLNKACTKHSKGIKINALWYFTLKGHQLLEEEGILHRNIISFHACQFLKLGWDSDHLSLRPGHEWTCSYTFCIGPYVLCSLIDGITVYTELFQF